MTQSTQLISMVSTILNDHDGLVLFFQQMEAQTRRPDEIVIVDGGSTDGTWELLQSYSVVGTISLNCYHEEGCNVARGRNLAIERATHNIIASTDIGCAWDSQWLEEIVAPLLENSFIDYVVGSWAVQPESVKTPWAKTELVYRNSHVFQATPESNATSRSIAYQKKVWQAVGGYPEDLTLAADDTIFDLLLKKHDFKASAAPIVRCYWHRFERLKQYLKEERRNFYGDGEAFIRQKHVVLIGGRLLIEILGLFGAIFLLVNPSWCYLRLIMLALALVSITHRVFRFFPKAKILGDMGVNFPLLRLLVFDYLTKLYSLRGYFFGFLRGFKHCQNCRERVHKIALTVE